MKPQGYYLAKCSAAGRVTAYKVVDNEKPARLPMPGFYACNTFDYGTATVAAANLALAILADYFGELRTKQSRAIQRLTTDSLSVRQHQAFKWLHIVAATGKELKIPFTEVDKFIKEKSIKPPEWRR